MNTDTPPPNSSAASKAEPQQWMRTAIREIMVHYFSVVEGPVADMVIPGAPPYNPVEDSPELFNKYLGILQQHAPTAAGTHREDVREAIRLARAEWFHESRKGMHRHAHENDAILTAIQPFLASSPERSDKERELLEEAATVLEVYAAVEGPMASLMAARIRTHLSHPATKEERPTQ